MGGEVVMDVRDQLVAIKDACRVLPRVGEPTTLDNVSKYIGVSKMALIKFIDANMDMFVLADKKVGKTVKKVIDKVYVDLSERPYTPQWLERMKVEHEHTIQLVRIDNYGWLQGYDLRVAEGDNIYCNLPEKVDYIAKALALEGPGWNYVVGGFMDCSTHRAKGYKVEEHHIPQIQALGFNVVTNCKIT